MQVRCETAEDVDAIRALTKAAFANQGHSSGTEAAIVDALRREGALAISLVAADGADIVGHVTFSPVTVGGRNLRYFGLGPVSVRPERQRTGIGSSLIRTGIAQLRAMSAKGCVLLGSPRYYGRFGFVVCPALCPNGLPSQFFQALAFDGE
ncbi:MAG: N-acetyltransferase, partial [Alphaproteobacteria bacterium]|nr:N-acetyltransferase [Alphaproteobacteria bacterium]